jgi:peptidoglycan/LPS O-acetylase OafA/YrhL
MLWRNKNIEKVCVQTYMKIQSVADENSYCDYIDGLRGIAILMVVAVHTSINCSIEGNNAFLLNYSRKLLEAGARGVQLFFILSAFTLYHSSLKRFRVDLLPTVFFYIRRAFRILPFWWIAVAYYSWSNYADFKRALPSIFFYFGFIRFDAVNEIVPGGWSLFVEETFYLFLPLLLHYIINLRKSFLFLFVTSLVAVTWVLFASRLGIPTSNSFVGLAPPTNYFCFALGIVVFYLYESPTYIDSWRSRIGTIYLVDGFLFMTLLLFITNRYVAAFSLAALVYVSSEKRSAFGQLTRQPWLMVCGRYCFSIYLLHNAVLDWIKPLKLWFFDVIGAYQVPVEFRFVALFPIVVIVAVVVSFITFNLIERPCVNLGKKFIRFINLKLGNKEVLSQ